MKTYKKLLVMVTCLLALAAVGRIEAAAENAVKQAPEWKSLKAYNIAEGTWRIEESGVNIYLVIGSERALVIDTGYGRVNLRGYLEKFTQLPLVILNTHGHPDHIGANDQFGAAYLNPADVSLYRECSSPAARARSAAMQKDVVIPVSEQAPATTSEAKLLPVSGGHVFDLGNRRLEVIETPGHSAGEIVLLDREHKLLFTGDNTNRFVWHHLKDCRPLSVYLKSLENLATRHAEYETILPGHGEPIPGDFISEQITCVKQILDGSATSEVYKSFAGDGRVATYKRATVTFDPENLRE